MSTPCKDSIKVDKSIFSAWSPCLVGCMVWVFAGFLPQSKHIWLTGKANFICRCVIEYRWCHSSSEIHVSLFSQRQQEWAPTSSTSCWVSSFFFPTFFSVFPNMLPETCMPFVVVHHENFNWDESVSTVVSVEIPCVCWKLSRNHNGNEELRQLNCHERVFLQEAPSDTELFTSLQRA